MKFEKKNFTVSSGWIHYNGEFVARIRRGAGGTTPFISFLMKNFEVEEYFNLLSQKDMAPLLVLETKGYISPNMKKVLKSYNLPCTQEGREELKKIMRQEWEK